MRINTLLLISMVTLSGLWGCSNSEEPNPDSKESSLSSTQSPKSIAQQAPIINSQSSPVLESSAEGDVLELTFDEFHSPDVTFEPGTRIRVHGRIREISSNNQSFSSDLPVSGSLNLFMEFPNATTSLTSLLVEDRSQLNGLCLEQEVTLETTIPDPEIPTPARWRPLLGPTMENSPSWKIVATSEPVTDYSDPHVVYDEAQIRNEIEIIKRLYQEHSLEGWGPLMRVLLIEDKQLTDEGLLPESLAISASQNRLFETVTLSCRLSTPLLEQVAKFPSLQTLELAPSYDENFGQHSFQKVSFQPLAQIRTLLDLEVQEVEGLTFQHFEQIGQIPHLRKIHLSGSPWENPIIIDDRWLVGLGQSQTVRWVDFSGIYSDVECQISEAGFRGIANARNLTAFEIKNAKITGAGLAAFANCPNLHLISLESSHLSPETLQSLKLCTGLRSLSVSGCESLGEQFGKLIFELPDLKALTAHQTDFGAGFFTDCPGHSNLQELNLGSTGLKSVPAEHLDGKNWPFITHLNVSKNEEIDDDFGFFHRLPPKIQVLSLEGTAITDQTISLIAKQFPLYLNTIYLDNCAITDEGLNVLAKTPPPRLQFVYFRGTKCTTEGIENFLENVPTLQAVGVPKTIDEETESLWEARFPEVSFY